jgi:hypothetical protein
LGVGASAASEASPQAGGTHTRQRPRFWVELVFGVASVALCFFFLPELYGWVVAKLGGPLTQAMVLHIFANCCANLIVVFAAWTTRGRLDQRLSGLVNATLGSHGASPWSW